MTIEEIQERKAKLESDIRDLIAAFQEETHCAVTDVAISRMDVTMLGSERRTVVAHVQATVEVP